MGHRWYLLRVLFLTSYILWSFIDGLPISSDVTSTGNSMSMNSTQAQTSSMLFTWESIASSNDTTKFYTLLGACLVFFVIVVKELINKYGNCADENATEGNERSFEGEEMIDTDSFPNPNYGETPSRNLLGKNKKKVHFAISGKTVQQEDTNDNINKEINESITSPLNEKFVIWEEVGIEKDESSQIDPSHLRYQNDDGSHSNENIEVLKHDEHTEIDAKMTEAHKSEVGGIDESDEVNNNVGDKSKVGMEKGEQISSGNGIDGNAADVSFEGFNVVYNEVIGKWELLLVVADNDQDKTVEDVSAEEDEPMSTGESDEEDVSENANH